MKFLDVSLNRHDVSVLYRVADSHYHDADGVKRKNRALPNNEYINGDPDGREKSFGAPEAQISPLAAQIGASAQTIFLSNQLQSPKLFVPCTH